MRAPAVIVVMLVGCGPTAPRAADAGVIDAGPLCVGAPAQLQATCVELDFFRTNACGVSAQATVASHLSDCDAGRPVSRELCGGLEAASWTYGPFGDHYQCFFDADGGGLLGALNFSDHGVLVAGTVNDCALIDACP